MLRHMLSASSVSGLFKWREFERKSSFWRLVGISRFSLSYRDVEELLDERVRTPITSRCGVGSSGMPQKWNDVCAEAETDQRQLASGRNLHPGQGQVGLWIPGCRLQRCDDPLPSVG